MNPKTQYYAQMSERAALMAATNQETWKGFLRASARLYKYSYQDQLMIYAQRPDATACAEYDFWNDRMRRYVKRGAKGIALVDTSGESPRLRYVFDVSDTGARRSSRPVNLWRMREEYLPILGDTLADAFEVTSPLLEDQLELIAGQLAAEYWNAHREELPGILAGSRIAGYDRDSIERFFWNAVSTSAAYSLFSRCVDRPEEYFQPEDFLDVFDFDTRPAIHALGTAVTAITGQVFREIERSIRSYERQKAQELRFSESQLGAAWAQENGTNAGKTTHLREGGNNYDEQRNERPDLHPARGLSAAGDPADPGRAEAPEQVRQDAPELSQGTPAPSVQRPGAERAVVPAPVGGPGDGPRADGAADGRTAGKGPGPGQGDAANGLGAAHEQPESAGGGSGAGGADPGLTGRQPEVEQISFLIPSETEQIQHIDEAESRDASAFSIRRISEEDITRALVQGTGFENGKFRVVTLYAQEPSAKARAAYLKQEYGIGGRSFQFADGGSGFVNYRTDGFSIEQYGNHTVVQLRWNEVEQRLRLLIHNGKYLSQVEQEEYTALEQQHAGTGGMPLPQAQHAFPPAQLPEIEAENTPAGEMLQAAQKLAAENDLAAPERFTVIETETGYALWDDLYERIYEDETGVSEEFTSEWEADAYWKGVVEKIEQQAARDWLTVERAKVAPAPEISAPNEARSELEEAKALIRQFCEEEYESEAELQDLAHIPIAYSTTEGEELPVQAYADLVNFRIERYLNDVLFDTRQYSSLRELMDQELANLDFQEPVQASEEEIAQVRKQPEGTTPAPTPIPEDAVTAVQQAAQNFRITDEHLGEGGPKAKFRANMDAIYLLKTLERSGRAATPEEQETLSRYVGWGGLADAFDPDKSSWARDYKELQAALTPEEYAAARASTLNAHYARFVP